MNTYYDNEISQAIIEKGKVHIYSHGDFDGIACAALFIKAFVPPNNDDYEASYIDIKVKDVNYNLEKEWSDYPFDDKAFNVVLDFPCANGIDCWVDHHKTGNKENLSTPKYCSFIDDNPSGVHSLVKLILNYNPKFIEDEDNKKTLGRYLLWSRVIDSAQYENVDEVMKPTDSAIIIDLCYKALKGPYDYFVWQLIKADLDFDKMIKDNPLFRAGGKRGASDGWKCFFFAKEHAQESNGVIILDLIDSNVNFARYSPWKLYPNAIYCLTSYTMTKENYGLSLSKNPFIKCPDYVDLSKIAEEYQGGGHTNAAGINANSKDKLYQIIQECGEKLENILVNNIIQEEK